MKITTGIAIAAAILATATSIPAQAAMNGDAHAQLAASCKAQAAKKFSVIHFMKRRSFVNDCMGRNAQAKATVHQTENGAKKAPSTTGQSVK
jgi:hypothetical protein